MSTDQMGADIRQIREDVTRLQISVSRIDDLSRRLDTMEQVQAKSAENIAKLVARDHQSTVKIAEKWFPWILAFLASGGLVSSEMLGVRTHAASAAPVALPPAIEATE
tara:strand:- start:277 stop:600 length:324 start_codon:yes stop_codon:yes gene_type:complete